MAGKLHPPYIDGKIPAFCGTVLRVPFRNNRAVNMFDVQGMVCKLKTVSTNEWVWTIQTDFTEDIINPIGTNEYVINFDLSTNYNERTYVNANSEYNGQNVPYYQWLTVGLYYKIQIAYIDKSNQIGYFSDVGVTKYTAAPIMYIDGLSLQGTSNSLYNYVGVYNQQGGDVTEKAFYYSFTIYDEKDNVFITSGEKTHNSRTDTSSYESHDEFYCNKELNPKKTYKIQYKVTTSNGLVCESPLYLIMKKETVKPQLNISLQADAFFDDGYIQLQMIPKDTKYYSGDFVISRASSKDNYETWDEICKFSLDKQFPNKQLFKDFTVEQGIYYTYAIQQYNTRGLYSSRIISNNVLADFEDMFLFDGQRQLKVRFNPTVQSFKNDILETKTDTIGNKYPYIFRNGHVKYKEFPIAGLISYLLDDQEFFLDKNKLGFIEFEGTDLTSDNIRAERIFKLEVMEWLNDGNVKLFRSPTEGNYLVRLMNISLAPSAPVGRMLHTFSCTAYEVGDTDFLTLMNYNMFTTSLPFEKEMRFKQIELSNYSPLYTDSTPPNIDDVIADNGKTPIFSGSKCYNAVFEDCAPDTIFGLQFESGTSRNLIEYIRIGETGIYEVNSHDNALIAVYPIWTPNINAELEADRVMDGRLTYGYYSAAAANNFSTIIDFNVYDVLSQWYGKHDNIIEEIEDLRRSTGRFYWLKFSTRNIEEIYSDSDDKIYSDAGQLAEIPYSKILPTTVYADKSGDEVRYYNGKDLIDCGYVYRTYSDNNTPYASYSTVLDNALYYWTDDTKDTWTNDENDIPVDRLYKFAINHQDYNVDLKTINRYIITDLDSVDFLSIGRFIMVDCYYQISEKTFAIEETNSELADLKYAYESALEGYYAAITSTEESVIGTSGHYTNQSYFDNLLTKPNGVNAAFSNYYERLEELLNAEVEG